MKLSLVIPCYNEAANLKLLFEKLDNFRNFSKSIEVIIVDNGSTDNSKDIIKKLLPNYSYVKLVKVKENKGYGNGILEGLEKASNEIIAWTHADLQTDPMDALSGLEIFKKNHNPKKIFVKGLRKGRPLLDKFFTIGMAFFEIFLLRKFLWDINAQPTMFHREFFKTWSLPPKDFSLDLFAYYIAKTQNLYIKRFPVVFGKRAHGVSHWNISFSSKLKFIKRTLSFSFNLKKRFK